MAEVIGELKKEGLFYGDKVRVKKENAEGGDVAVSEDEAPKKRDKKEKSKKVFGASGQLTSEPKHEI